MSEDKRVKIISSLDGYQLLIFGESRTTYRARGVQTLVAGYLESLALLLRWQVLRDFCGALACMVLVRP